MSADIFPAFYLSLKVALTATLINLILGTTTGFILARKSFLGRETLDTLLTLPLVLPPTVVGYYLLVLFGKQGTLGQWLKATFDISLVFTWQGAALAAAVVTFPLVVKPARVAFEGVNHQLEQAASVLGLSSWSIFWRVTLPLAWRGILAGILLTFARALGEFGATLMIAGSIPEQTQTLSIAIYEAVQAGDDQLANQLVLLISAVCITILWTTTRLAKSKPHF